VDRTRLNSSSTSLIINGLSDNDDQFIAINNTAATVNLVLLRRRSRKIDSKTVVQFQLLLRNETLVSVYKSKDTTNKFNSFLCIFLNMYEASFQDIHTQCRNISDPHKKAFYVKYCNMAKEVTEKAKKQNYNRLIAKSVNKIKTTWNVI
jgi:hypothetical protein